MYVDPLSYNLTFMYINLVTDYLNEYAYDAQLAGLTWEIACSEYGISVRIFFFVNFPFYTVQDSDNMFGTFVDILDTFFFTTLLAKKSPHTVLHVFSDHLKAK